MPRGAVGQLVLLEQHHVGLAHLGEVVGDAAAEDAAADDDDPRLRRNGSDGTFVMTSLLAFVGS